MVRHATLLSQILGAFICIVGLLSFIGYQFGLEWLYRPFVDGSATHPLTAAYLLLLGYLILALRHLSAFTTRSIAALVLLLCLLRITDYVTHDNILNVITPFQSVISVDMQRGLSNQTGWNTALSLMVVAAALICHSYQRLRISQVLSFAALFFPTTSLTGYLFGLEKFYGAMSPITCLLCGLAGLACLLHSANEWVMSVLLGRGRVSHIARLQLLASILFPFLMGYLFLAIDIDDVSSLFAVGTVAFMWFSIFLISYSTLHLQRFEDKLVSTINSLEVSETRFRNLFQHGPVASLLVDQSGQVESANQAASDLLDYSNQQLCTQNVSDLVPEAKNLLSGLEESKPEVSEIYTGIETTAAVSRDGSSIPVEIHLATMTSSEANEILIAMLDRTEIQHYIDSLRRSNIELDQFAYIASHDLKAPLRAVMNLTHFIEQDVGDTLSGETLGYFNLLKSRVKRMEKLLDDLLEYSRVGRQAAKSHWIDVRSAISELQKLYVADYGFSVSLSGEQPKIFAPQAQFELVARNLMMNSIKHHPKPPGTIYIWLTEEDQGTCVYFADDGSGIAPKYRDRVFKIFTTLKSRDEVEGSGMGLALVQKSMQILGGNVRIVDSQYCGATFRVWYPNSIQT